MCGGNRFSFFFFFFFWFLVFEERREDLTKDSDKFNVIINEVEKLHEQGISLVYFQFVYVEELLYL